MLYTDSDRGEQRQAQDVSSDHETASKYRGGANNLKQQNNDVTLVCAGTHTLMQCAAWRCMCALS